MSGGLFARPATGRGRGRERCQLELPVAAAQRRPRREQAALLDAVLALRRSGRRAYRAGDMVALDGERVAPSVVIAAAAALGKGGEA